MSEYSGLNKPSPSRSHWGVFEPIVEGCRLVAVKPFAKDPNPSLMLGFDS